MPGFMASERVVPERNLGKGKKANGGVCENLPCRRRSNVSPPHTHMLSYPRRPIRSPDWGDSLKPWLVVGRARGWRGREEIRHVVLFPRGQVGNILDSGFFFSSSSLIAGGPTRRLGFAAR